MRTLQKISGIVVTLTLVICYALFIFGTFESRINASLVLAFCLLALALYFGFQFLFLTKFGFTNGENNNKHNKAVAIGLPILLTVISLSCVTYNYMQSNYHLARQRKEKDAQDENEKKKKEELILQRNAIPFDTALTLAAKIEKMNIGKYVNNLHTYTLTDAELEKVKPAKTTELNDYFENFRFKNGNVIALPGEEFISNGFVKASPEEGKDFKVKLTDQVAFLGQLPEQKMLVFAEELEGEETDYFCRSLTTGNIIDGLPLLTNIDGQLLANVWFDKSENAIYLRISMWERLAEYDPTLFLNERLPFITPPKGEYFPYTIKTIFWMENTFYFTIASKSNSREHVNVAMKAEFY